MLPISAPTAVSSRRSTPSRSSVIGGRTRPNAAINSWVKNGLATNGRLLKAGGKLVAPLPEQMTKGMRVRSCTSIRAMLRSPAQIEVDHGCIDLPRRQRGQRLGVADERPDHRAGRNGDHRGKIEADQSLVFRQQDAAPPEMHDDLLPEPETAGTMARYLCASCQRAGLVR